MRKNLNMAGSVFLEEFLRTFFERQKCLGTFKFFVPHFRFSPEIVLGIGVRIV